MVWENPYDILELSETAHTDEIHSAYLRAVRAHPPESDPEGFKKIRNAYDRICNREARKKFGFESFKNESGIPPSSGLHVAPSEKIDPFFRRIAEHLVSNSDIFRADFTCDFKQVDDIINNLS